MRPGEVLADRFVVECLAGRGGMGAVYRARDLATGGTVALKLLTAHSDEARRRFVREARILADLSHENIVRHLAHGATPDGLAFLAMDWLDGEDLAARLERGPLDLGETLSLAEQVAGALAVAHAGGVVHRDIKPSNIFLVGGRVGDARVLDFGVAKTAHASAATRTGLVLGTLGYMSPEQIRGESDVGAMADVFALGCVLFECLAGRPAFAGEHAVAILAKVVLEAPPRLAEAVGGVPVALDELVDRMLRKAPEERPRDASEVLVGLRTVEAGGLRGPAIPSSPAPRQSRLLALVLVASRDAGTDDTLPVSWARAGTGPLSDDGERSPLLSVARAFGGVWAPLAGRGAVVSFSGERAATDLAARAARFALAVREKDPHARAVVAAGIGDTESGSTGSALERGADLLEKAAPGEILVHEVAGNLLVGFDLQPDERGVVLVAERPLDDAGRRLLGMATPCVGRDRELSVLSGLFGDCVEEPSARAVLITSGAGLGKSRLRRELIASLPQAPKPTVWFARGDPVAAGAPLGMLAGALRRAAGVSAGAPIVDQRRRLENWVGSVPSSGDLWLRAAFLAELLGVGASSEPDPRVLAGRADRRLLWDQMLRAFLDHLDAELARAPVVLVLEDLHWGDVSTLAFVDAALREHHERPLFVLALARPEVSELSPSLWEHRGVHHIRLGQLTKRACEQLVRAVVGDVPSATLDKVVAQSAGNAFFLEELIRAVARGELEAFPETILAMVQARFETLDPGPREALRAASVFGETFWYGGVLAVLDGLAPADVSKRLAELETREWIVRRSGSRLAGDIEYGFRHAFVRDVAHASYSPSDAARVHRVAAGWLARHGETDQGVIAGHLEIAGDVAKAAAAWLAAARQALEGPDQTATLRACDRGLACSREPSVRAGLLVQKARALVYRAHLTESRDAALEALSHLRVGSRDWIDAISTLSLHRSRFERQVVPYAERLMQVDVDADVVDVAASALGNLASYFYLAQMRDLGRRARDRLQHLRGAHPHAAALIEPWLFRAETAAAISEGRFGPHLRHARAAVEAFERIGDRRAAANMEINHAFALQCLGAFEAAKRGMETGAERCRELGLDLLALVHLHNLARVLAQLGDPEAGLMLGERVLAELVEAGGVARFEGSTRIHLAANLADLGRVEEALAQLDAIPEGVLEDPSVRVATLALRSRAHRARDLRASALELSRQAMRVMAEAGGIEKWELATRLAHAEALLAAEHQEEAHEALRCANARIDELCDEVHEPELQRSFIDRVPEVARLRALLASLGADPG